MKVKSVAGLAFLLNTILFGTYYAVSKEALNRIDPIVFTFFEMTTLVPAALCIIAFSWRHMTRAVVKRGILLGSCLCLALFTIAIALKYTSATSTAFFPSLNGFLAALIAGIFLRLPISKATWGAGLLSIIGTTLLIVNSPMGGIRGSLIAFLGGLFFTCYVFLADYEQKRETAHWPLFGIELLTMAVWAHLIVLLFGDWQAFHPSLPKDVWVIVYVAGACTFLPTLITVLMQKHISPVTVSFIYILEPVFGALVANVYLHEVLPLEGYIGGGLIVAGAVIQAWGNVERPSRPASELLIHHRLVLASQRINAAFWGTLVYPLLLLTVGVSLLYRIGGLPPSSWRTLYTLSPLLTASLQPWHDTTIQLVAVQAACWLIAWTSLLLASGIGLVRATRALVEVLSLPAPVKELYTDALPEIELWEEHALQEHAAQAYSYAPSYRKNGADLPAMMPGGQQHEHQRRQFIRVELLELTE